MARVKFDTGSKGCTIDESIDRGYEVIGKVKYGSGLGGDDQLDIKDVVIFPFKLPGGAKWDSLEAVVTNLPANAGYDILLGYEFFKDYIVRIDYHNKQLHFCYRCPEYLESAYTNFDFTGNSLHILLPARINGKVYPNFILDTGAGSTLISEKLQKELALPIRKRPKVIQIDAAGDTIITQFHKISKLELLDHEFKRINTVTIVDLKAFNEVTGIGHSGFIGHDVLEKSIVQIDFWQKRIAILKHK